jgi:hypothetical protein
MYKCAGAFHLSKPNAAELGIPLYGCFKVLDAA